MAWEVNPLTHDDIFHIFKGKKALGHDDMKYVMKYLKTDENFSVEVCQIWQCHS